jgi:thiamine biosynthesis protein ThiS
MSSTESVSINGAVQPIESGVRTVADLLTALGVPLEGTLVEQNGVALFPRDFGRTPVAAGDRFELVRIAAGG